MNRIQTQVQVFVRGHWKDSKKPRWVIQADLCNNFPLCNRKIPSRRARSFARFRHKEGYCTEECFEKYKDKGHLKQQKLNDFLNGVNSND